MTKQEIKIQLESINLLIERSRQIKNEMLDPIVEVLSLSIEALLTDISCRIERRLFTVSSNEYLRSFELNTGSEHGTLYFSLDGHYNMFTFETSLDELVFLSDPGLKSALQEHVALKSEKKITMEQLKELYPAYFIKEEENNNVT
jgi:hypothetical protein